jgi:hypothetical protein
MKINDAVLQRLDSNKGLGLIMRALDVSHSTARAYIKANDDNLTKAAMLEAIREEYGLTDEEILVRELPEEAQS